MCTTLFDASNGKSVKFILPDSLIFNNLSTSISAFEFDAGIGQGWVSYGSNQELTVNYPDIGIYFPKLRIQVNNNWYVMSFRLEIKESNDSVNRTGSYDTKHPEIHQVGGTQLSIYYSCGKKLKKPLIIVEGYPNEFTYPDKDLFGEKGLIKNYDLRPFMENQEYDIIYVDWLDNSTSVGAAADKMIEVIDWVNNKKKLDGSGEPNVLIGASFGGLVSRYALLKMHNILNKKSDVSQFFTYDSPLKGANVPKSLQAAIIDVEDLYPEISKSIPEFIFAKGLLNGPAAKEMIIDRVIKTNSNQLGVITAPEFTALQTTLAGLEAIKPINQITRYTAFSNGANNGKLQDSVYSTILGLYYSLSYADHLKIGGQDVIIDIANLAKVDLSGHLISDNGVNTTFYTRDIIITTADHVQLYTNSRILTGVSKSLDNAPGGISALGIDIIGSSLGLIPTFLPKGIILYENDVNLKTKYFCFIPTVSSLDMPLGTNFTINNPTGGSLLDRFSASNTTELTNSYTLANDINQDHVTMDERISNILKEELGNPTNFPLVFPLTGSSVYNMGTGVAPTNTPIIRTPHSIGGIIDIKDNAQLWINRKAKLGLQTGNNPQNTTPLTLTVTVPGIYCTDGIAATMNVLDNAKVLVGDNSNGHKSKLHFSDYSVANISATNGIEVEVNSELSINGLSNVNIKSNGSILNKGTVSVQISPATLTIESGGFINSEWGAKLIIGKGGKVVVKAGGTLRVSHYSQLIVDDGGQLIIEPGANIQLWDGNQVNGEATIYIKKKGELVLNGEMNFSGNGFFQFDADNILSVNGSMFKIVGEGKQHRLIRLNNNAKLKIPLNKTAEISNAKVEYTRNSKIVLQSGSKGNFDNMLFESIVHNTLPDDNTSIYADYSSELKVDHSNFKNLFSCIETKNFNSPLGVKVYNTNFENCGGAVLCEYVKSLDMYNNEFTMVDFAVKLKDSESGVVDNCRFFGNHCYRAIDLNFYKYFTIKNCNINNYKNENGDAIAVYAENLLANGAGQLLINNSTLTNNNLAVGTPDKNAVYFNQSVNIYVSESYFSNNNIAIRNRGGVYYFSQHYYGLVSLDCSTFENNDIGVDGENVKLVVDINKYRPNKFIASSPQLYFNICYGYGVTTPTTITAKYQYWSYNGIGGITPDNTMYLLGDCPGGNNTTLDASNKITLMAACAPLPTGGKAGFNEPDRICTVTSSNTPIINERFADGYEQLMNGSWSSAEHLMQPIADLTSSVLPASQPICNVYVDFARHLVVPNLQQPNHSNISSRDKEDFGADNSNIKIYPNPTTNGFTLTTDGVLNQIVVFNTLGQKIYQKIIPTNSYYINTNDWESGIYLVKTKDTSGETHIAKVMVQKEIRN